MGAKQFDYYIFIDYSESLLGYLIIERNKVLSYLLKNKIRKANDTPEIYSDILEFLKEHNNCFIFISVDNKQYSNFERLVKIIDGVNTKVVRESELRKDTFEYRISLVLDTLLNIERLKHEK